MLGDSLGYTYGGVLVSNKVIKLGPSDGKVLETVLGNVDEIKLGVDVGIEPAS